MWKIDDLNDENEFVLFCSNMYGAETRARTLSLRKKDMTEVKIVPGKLQLLRELVPVEIVEMNVVWTRPYFSVSLYLVAVTLGTLIALVVVRRRRAHQ
jgi:hypothetical protein